MVRPNASMYPVISVVLRVLNPANFRLITSKVTKKAQATNTHPAAQPISRLSRSIRPRSPVRVVRTVTALELSARALPTRSRRSPAPDYRGVYLTPVMGASTSL